MRYHHKAEDPIGTAQAESFPPAVLVHPDSPLAMCTCLLSMALTGLRGKDETVFHCAPISFRLPFLLMSTSDLRRQERRQDDEGGGLEKASEERFLWLRARIGTTCLLLP